MDVLYRLRHLPQRLVGSKQFAITEACVIGLVSGLAAVLLKQSVGVLGGWRVQMATHIPAVIILPTIGLIGGWLAGLLVERLAPEAAGSGIPPVKAVLANVPQVLNLRVALVKMASVILVLGSGLNLGRQGPTVHVGAALAAQLSQWIPTSPEHRRQLIAAGAAAGLAAGFNAPIAGVLFVVEEFLQDFSGLTLGTAILASFIGAVVSRVLGGRSLSLDAAIASLNTTFSVQDLPFFLLLGLLAGVLGALFNQGIFTSLRLNRQVLQMGLPWRIALAGFVSGSVAALLPSAFRDNTGLQDFLSTGSVGWQFLLVAFAIKFLLTLVAYGSGAPGGLFAPSLVLGAALGSLVGLLAHGVATAIGGPLMVGAGVSETTTYALAGMGAFFSAVTRGPITAIVIVFEITTDFNLVLPLMIGSVIAYLVAHRLVGGSIYTHLLAWSGIELGRKEVEGEPWRQLTAAMVMQPRVETLPSQIPINEAKQAFARSHHRGFPVVDDGKLVGIVTQSDLATRSVQVPDSDAATLSQIMTPQPLTVTPDAPLTDVLYMLNRFQLSRLPVTEGTRLVGIITRADIIRAESDQISGDGRPFGPQPEPSYVVYQTRSPNTGRGRLLLPLSNPQTAPLLMKLAVALATDRQYELELLQVIPVSRGRSPATTPVRTTASRRLLRHIEALGQDAPISIHTQVRVAHDVSQAVLETIKERHIDQVLMGWKGNTSTPGRVLGSVVDTLVRQAPCEVLLARLSDTPRFDRWLLPLAGGPNSQAALQLLPAMLTLAQQPEVRLCQVLLIDKPVVNSDLLQEAASLLMQHTSNVPIYAQPVWGDSVPEAIVRLAAQKHYDVIVLGASREGLLAQVMQGNIPEAIARNSSSTVLLVRGTITSEST
ncbi:MULTISPECIES: chloride channel protein [unclassified Leptolyngbya]|uniref:chloride channel protein n=1 Tax=unclassified Leptolyngbya TaxID=2650499 RepID=UPI00168897B2|nr:MULTISPECIES: chloride channel protein [unclassified Leptolyngbya]MBD1913445.1 chloride channel protein [Leptolyngbya sp. FACHB-8]MBD2155840.1 chloride channel protein [Leptolyngbya sp. FACHB-16]